MMTLAPGASRIAAMSRCSAVFAVKAEAAASFEAPLFPFPWAFRAPGALFEAASRSEAGEDRAH